MIQNISVSRFRFAPSLLAKDSTLKSNDVMVAEMKAILDAENFSVRGVLHIHAYDRMRLMVIEIDIYAENNERVLMSRQSAASNTFREELSRLSGDEAKEKMKQMLMDICNENFDELLTACRNTKQ